MFDLRAVPQADLHRRPDRRVRAVGRAVRAVPVPDALHAGRSALFGAPDRAAVPGALRRDPADVDAGRAADGARPDPAADRPGLALVGVGLLLMRGLTPASGWTHLIPGFIIAGAGTGLVNPPLASTAIGVVTSGARRHGVRDQLDLPPDRDRHRHRRLGLAVLAYRPHPHRRRADLAPGLAVARPRAARAGARVPRAAAPPPGWPGCPAQRAAVAVHAVRASFVTGAQRGVPGRSAAGASCRPR